MYDETQGRAPANAPHSIGGQWLQKLHSDPEATLPGETRGSFLFPPVDYNPNTVESYLEFWQTVPVSDRVLSNLTTSYLQNRERWIGEELDKWAAARDADPGVRERIRKKKLTDAQILAEHEAARTAKLAELQTERPIAAIGPIRARAVAVAAQIYRCSGGFSAADQDEIEAHVVHFPREEWTVKEVWERYHLAEIADRAFVDQDLGVQQELAELRHHLGAFYSNQ